MRWLTAKGLLAGSVGLALFVLPISVNAAADSGGQTFKLKKVSVLKDLPKKVKEAATRGASNAFCRINVPKDKDIKAFPKPKSDKAFYGTAMFFAKGLGLPGTDPGQKFCLVLDESKGTGKGYDTLIVDANHDFDLTNDAVLKLVKDSPLAVAPPYGGEKPIVFDSFKLAIPGAKKGDGLTVWPVVRMYSKDVCSVGFVCETAYAGKIKIADKEHDIVLAQIYSITGGFDSTMVSLFFGDDSPRDGMPIAYYHSAAGKLWDIIPSATGDTLTVKPLEGAMCQIDFVCGDKKAQVSNAMLLSDQSRIIDASEFTKDGKPLMVPAGNYAIVNASVAVGEVTTRLSMLSSEKMLYPIKATKGKAFAIDFKKPIGGKVTSPAEDNISISQNGSVNISASFFDDKQGFALGAVSVKGKTLEPAVKVYDASGKVIAQGKMPFG
ncbi:MAG: hypothetical protein JEZ07_19455 [Phycisphaerae bacterium]|nr:hypothetical protein [Phycisphaerae bacterium]